MPSNSEKVRLIFGLKLKQLRQDKGIPLNVLADRAGFSVSYLNEIEKGKKYPKSDKIFALAKALDTDYDTLVSMKLGKKLEPITELLNSNILQELPLELFGIDLSNLLELLSDAPAKVSSFIHTIIEISRSYGMNVEQFYFSALRSYQELHDNYFPEIETAADAFLAKRPAGEALDGERLLAMLEGEFGYRVSWFNDADRPDLKGLRSVMLPGPPDVLLVNEDMEPEQVAFTYGREIGYHVLGLHERPLLSSVIEAETFEQVLNNFKASYFAGALLVPRAELARGMDAFFALPTFEPDRLLALMHSFRATPEVFVHRLSQVMTSHFGINGLFFLRFDHVAGQDTFHLTKEMHLAKLHNPHGTVSEHFCRRLVAITILRELAAFQKMGVWDGRALCRAQVARYMDTGSRYLVISLAKPSPPKGHNSSVSIGFAIDEKFGRLVRFLGDAGLEERDVNETCQRCGAPDCLERAHPPTLWQRQKRNEALKETLRQLQAGQSRERNTPKS
jgi:hypothetical protein